MLPDDPSLKADLLAALTRFVQQRWCHHLNFLADAPRQQLFEGRGTAIRRQDGRLDHYPTQELKSEFSIPTPELPDLTLEQILEHADRIALDLARQQSAKTFSLIIEATEQSGNVINSRGQPFSVEHILEALSSIDLDFDEDGKQKGPLNVVIPPALRPAAEAALTALKSDPELQKRYSRIIDSKREEWRAREAARKLVG